ncbi:MAG: hypothetical protein LC775_09280, partial [Acidobacteria bacterium]|nr:hypothetical protein [Acidobacteriota bacterium]
MESRDTVKAVCPVREGLYQDRVVKTAYGVVFLPHSDEEYRQPAANARVFEIRTYTTSQKMDVFKTFFIANTMKLFKKYDFEVIGYWLPQDPP